MQAGLSAEEQQRRKREALREIAHELAPKPSDRAPSKQRADIEETWTLQEKLEWRLRFFGISEDAASQIVERVKALPIMEPLKDRWNEYAENWSPAFHGALWRQAKTSALKWIDENPAPDPKTQLIYKSFRSDVTL